MSHQDAHTSSAGQGRLVSRLRLLAIVAMGIGALVVTLVLVRGPLPARADNIGGFRDANGSKGGYWNKPDTAFYMKRTAITDSRTFFLGDTVTLPSGLELTISRVERNWQPPAVVSASFGRYADGDNPAGREILLVWFTGTNRGTGPIGFSDNAFTLTRAGRPEQRVAQLASLPPSAYGDQGVQPWLLPGESKTTFVPFLVNPGEVPTSFHYYEAPGTMPTDATSLPTLTRVSFQLAAPEGRQARSFTFRGDTTLVVGQ